MRPPTRSRPRWMTAGPFLAILWLAIPNPLVALLAEDLTRHVLPNEAPHPIPIAELTAAACAQVPAPCPITLADYSAPLHGTLDHVGGSG